MSADRGLPLYDLSPGIYDDYFGRYRFAGNFHCRFHDKRHFGAAGYFHDSDSHAFNVRRTEYLGKLIDIFLGIVEFGTTEHEDLSFQEIFMKAGISGGCAIRGDKKIGVL